MTAAAITADDRPDMGSLSLKRRALAFAVILLGYFLYAYNWQLVDYVRPNLMADYGFTLKDTTKLSMAQNLGITIGAMVAASVIARIGRRSAITAISIGAGLLTLMSLFLDHLAAWVGLRFAICLFLGGYYVSAVSLMSAMFPQNIRARLAAFFQAAFSSSEIALGMMGGALGDEHWRMLIWVGALAPIVIGMVLVVAAPDDRRYRGLGNATDAHAAPGAGKAGSWAEMISRRWVVLTLACLMLAGLKFTGYQLFSGYVTTFLKVERGFSAQEVGALVSMIGVGWLLGAFGWAFVADRFGRKICCIGFFAAAAFVGAYLFAPHEQGTLKALGFGYGLCLSCSNAWGVWFTEIFPERLRPFGVALVHAGHIISMSAPLAIGALAERYGLAFGMALAPIVFLSAGVIWAFLPETLARSPLYRGYSPE